MKKHLLILLSLFMLFACSQAAEYDQLMRSGLEALENEDVETAKDYFKEAKEHSNSFEPEHYLELITLANNFNSQMQEAATEQAQLTLNNLMMKDKHEVVDFLIKENKEKLINQKSD